MRLILAVMVVALSMSSVLTAQEKKLKKSDLPSAVQKAVGEQSTGATVTGYSSEMESGKREYEVQMKVNGHNRDVTIAPDGTVLEIENEVELNSLPQNVREGLQRKAGKGTITKIESLTKSGRLVAYEAQLKNGSKRSDIQVGPDGNPLSHPE